MHNISNNVEERIKLAVKKKRVVMFLRIFSHHSFALGSRLNQRRFVCNALIQPDICLV